MNMLEKFLNVTTNHDEELFAARNSAQAELAESIGVELGVWIDMGYHDKFREVLDANPTILEDLLDKSKHDEIIAELKNKLYH